MIKWVRKALHSEVIRYGISGGMVTVTNAAGYFLLLQAGVFYTTANIISLIMSKVVGYVLNKFWVYHSRNDNFIQALLEMLRFILARGFTGLVDFFGVIVLVEFCGWSERISKIIVMALVIVLNYVLGKKAVFYSKAEK